MRMACTEAVNVIQTYAGSRATMVAERELCSCVVRVASLVFTYATILNVSGRAFGTALGGAEEVGRGPAYICVEASYLEDSLWHDSARPVQS